MDDRPAQQRRTLNFVARTRILDQIGLVFEVDRTGALSDFIFGSPLTLLVWIVGTCGMEKAMQESEDKFRCGEGHQPPFSNSLYRS